MVTYNGEGSTTYTLTAADTNAALAQPSSSEAKKPPNEPSACSGVDGLRSTVEAYQQSNTVTTLSGLEALFAS